MAPSASRQRRCFTRWKGGRGRSYKEEKVCSSFSLSFFLGSSAITLISTSPTSVAGIHKGKGREEDEKEEEVGGREKRKPTWLPPKAPTPHFFSSSQRGRIGMVRWSVGLDWGAEPFSPFSFHLFSSPSDPLCKGSSLGKGKEGGETFKRNKSSRVGGGGGGEIGSADGEGVDQGVDFSPSKTKTKSFLSATFSGEMFRRPREHPRSISSLVDRSMRACGGGGGDGEKRYPTQPTLSRFSSEGGIFGKFE